MQNSAPVTDDLHHQPAVARAPARRKTAGRALIALASLGFLLVLLVQILQRPARPRPGSPIGD